MADLFDRAFWQGQWDAFANAPVPSLILLAVGAASAWWLRGQTKEGEINGLKAQIAALDERLTLAAEKMQQREETVRKLDDELTKLREQSLTKPTGEPELKRWIDAQRFFTELRGLDDDVEKILGKPLRRHTVVPTRNPPPPPHPATKPPPRSPRNLRS
jgi:hypothetical protein